jgi:CRISPR-associated endonuclease/helicase Cas3
LLSLAMIDDVAALQSKANDWDLVQHLVSTHHGYCRPLPPFVTDTDPQSVTHEAEGCELVATTDRAADPGLDMTERFWVLVRRYGWFGLAWFESIFRLADHRQSEHESNLGANRD